jgi:hypothetical protein
VPEHIKKFLISLGIADEDHSGRTFLDHCEGVYQLLKDQGEVLSSAGALHSIYGTRYYRPSVTPTRHQVRNLIGPEAEELVHLFCTLERHQIVRLAKLVEANAREQDGR